ncbi:DUF6232 family protein [Micromonosporaceae bacterium Da 78-11]
MRIYYDGPDVLITESQFVWRAQPRRSFAIAHLRNVRLVRRDVKRSVRGPALVSALAATMVLTPGWMFLTTPFGRIGLVATAVAIVTLATARRRTVRQWELRAAYLEREVTLYAAVEIRTFNQVTRALRRSVEDAAPPRTRHQAAAA